MPDHVRSEQSYIWNINKKKWTYGPRYEHAMKFTFHYACPITLNTSAVEKVSYIKQVPKPKYTYIYNFETKIWTQQDSLDFGNEKFLIGYDQNMACTTEQKKDYNR